MNKWTKDTTIGAIVVAIILIAVGWGIWALIAWMSSGPGPMTNDEIIRETKKCKDAGLYPTHYPDWSMNTVRIICENKNT